LDLKTLILSSSTELGFELRKQVNCIGNGTVIERTHLVFIGTILIDWHHPHRRHRPAREMGSQHTSLQNTPEQAPCKCVAKRIYILDNLRKKVPLMRKSQSQALRQKRSSSAGSLVAFCVETAVRRRDSIH
jgi:hypothetical protein